MKKYIHKINQYLIENHPTIWNTRIIWMLLVSLLIHLVFYVLGYTTLTNPEMLHERNAKEIFFRNGVVFFNIILSIMLLVVWLIYLFKNNAFKNFYPTSKLKLFSQFISYVIIIFFTTTFYYSYNAGLKSYISSVYPDEVISKEIENINRSSVFFVNSIEYYTLDNLSYPVPFSDLYCEKNLEFIDKNKPYLTWLEGEEYQFYSLKTKSRKKTVTYNSKDIYNDFVFTVDKDSVITYFFKDTVVDVSKILKTPKPSYYNYSNTFYTSIDENNDGNILYKYETYPGYEKNTFKKKARNKQVYELLNRNNTEEIKELLGEAYAIFEKYKIKKNITIDKWFELIYQPEDFIVNSLLRTEGKDILEYTAVNKELTLKEKYIKEHTTTYYISTDDLHTVFYNIENIKNENYYSGSIHLFMWMTFILAVLVFLYRVTSLRALLFSIVAAGVLVLFIALLTAIYRFVLGSAGTQIEYFISYVSLFIGAIIFAVPLFLHKKTKKMIVAIFMNISIAIFPFYIFLITGIISIHQRANCKELYGYSYDDKCFVLLENIGINLSYLLFVVGILFVYFYSSIIKKWKSLPEG